MGTTDGFSLASLITEKNRILISQIL